LRAQQNNLAIPGARIGMTSVLHTWGSTFTHHPHIHIIVPGGGLSPDGTRWISCRPGFFLPVRILSRLFRRLFLQGLTALHRARDLAGLAEDDVFTAWLAPLRRAEWVVYANPPSAAQRPWWPISRPLSKPLLAVMRKAGSTNSCRGTSRRQAETRWALDVAYIQSIGVE
jgi:hypothetical protein